MIEQRVTLRYDAQQIPAIVQAVQGDTGRDVIFELADYEIPAGATANYYIDKPDDTAIYNSAEVISSTEILAHLTEQALAVPGRNNGQVRILSDDEVITSFDFVLEVEAFRGILRLQSETEVNIFDQAIEDAVNTATEEAVAEIQAQTPVVTGMQNSIAPTYSASSTYAVGDYVMYNAQLYRCITAITTAEAWTAAHWTQVPLANDVANLKNAINPLAPFNIAGNEFKGDRIPYSKELQLKYAYTSGTTLIIANKSNMNVYIVPVEPSKKYKFSLTYFWALTDELLNVLLGSGSSYNSRTELDTADYPTAKYFYASYYNTDATPTFMDSDADNSDGGTLSWLRNNKNNFDKAGMSKGIEPDFLHGSECKGNIILYYNLQRRENKFAYGPSAGSKISTENNNTNFAYYVVPVKAATKYYVLDGTRFWGLTDDEDTVLVGSGSSGSYISSIDTTDYPDAAKFYYSVPKAESNPWISEIDNGTEFSWQLEGLHNKVRNKDIDDDTINVKKLQGIEPVENLIPYFMEEQVDNKYAYGVVGNQIAKGNNSQWHYWVIPVEENTKYYFNLTPWWGLVDDSNIVLAGGGDYYQNPASSIDTTDYPTAKKLYISGQDVEAEYCSKKYNGRERGWTIEGLKLTDQEDIFCIPDFKYLTNKEFRFYSKNASLDNNTLNKINSFTGDEQYTDGYGLKATSAASRLYSYSEYDKLLNSKGAAAFTVTFADKNARNLTALFIGDSTINAGSITQKVLDVFGENNVTCTLLGQRGQGLNRHEGIGGWTASECWGAAAHGSYDNHFYDSEVGHFDFEYYMNAYDYPDPDFVFIQFGINDFFNSSPFAISSAYDTYKNAMINIIENIHNYNTSIKIVVNMIPMPNESVSKYNELYGTAYYSWERRATDIQANARLINDMPDYVIMNPHHLVLDSATMIQDDVHMTAEGYSILGALDADVMFVN